MTSSEHGFTQADILSLRHKLEAVNTTLTPAERRVFRAILLQALPDDDDVQGYGLRRSAHTRGWTEVAGQSDTAAEKSNAPAKSAVRHLPKRRQEAATVGDAIEVAGGGIEIIGAILELLGAFAG